MKHIHPGYYINEARGIWEWVVVVESDSHPGTLVFDGSYASFEEAHHEVMRRIVEARRPLE